MKRIILSCVFVLVAAAPARDVAPSTPNGHIYGPLLGKRVTLDALVWNHPKGISGRVVLPSGESVYVEEPSARRSGGAPEVRLPAGRLVRLVGVLRVKRQEPAPPGAQGYGEAFSYLSLALESFTIIERAEREFPERTAN